MAALTKIDAFEKLFKTKQAGLGAVNVCGSGGGSRRLVRYLLAADKAAIISLR